MLTYDEATAKVAASRSGRPRLGHNTTLRMAARDNAARDNYAIRLHYTDVVTIHPDGTYSLSTGGWHTVTTTRRINAWSPAHVYSDHGLFVWHHTDPQGPPKMSKCRHCHGEGTTAYGTCSPCQATGQRDYGSKANPIAFYDGIVMDGTGKVVSGGVRRDGTYVPPEPGREPQYASNARRWLGDRGITPNEDGTYTLIKAVDKDFKSSRSLPGGKAAIYAPGATLVAPDYNVRTACGGGLHFSPTTREAEQYYVMTRKPFASQQPRFVECAVDGATLIKIDRDKAKARSCRVLREIDRRGRPVASEDSP